MGDDERVQVSQRVRLVVAALVAVAGLLAVVGTFGLTWNEPEIYLGPMVRMLMACSGALIIILAALPWQVRTTSTRVLVALLGFGVLIYPTTLSLAAAGAGGPVIEILGSGGHVLPLVLVQLLPVLISQVVTGRSRHGWLCIMVVVAVVNVLPAIPVVQRTLGSTALDAAGTVLWMGSFALAPIATWPMVRGTAGETRRRVIIAGLASVVPVVIIAWCLTLGAAAETQGLSENAAVTALMCGFALATSSTALLVWAACGPDDSPVLRGRVIVFLLAGLLIAATMLIAIGSGLAAVAAGLGSGSVLLVGIAMVAVCGLGSLRLFGWAAKVIDPYAELAQEIAALGVIADGEQRQSIQQVLRRVVGDPGLELVVLAADGTWVDALDVVTDRPPSVAYALAGAGSDPTALAIPSLPTTTASLARLGDCEALLRPAILEATVLREKLRAADAARAERVRLSQNLHDGLQGRLLGIALNLQLSGRQVDDPTTRLLVDQTVTSLREAVEDVRALGGGSLPATLVDGGLRPALADLVRPLATVVDLQVSDARFAPEIEATGYFVVGEAVSNAIKHGSAGQVSVRVEAVDDRLTILVTDDGVGGADPRLGSGLRGLAERVSACGGLLVVRDRTPVGTVVEASLPCGS